MPSTENFSSKREAWGTLPAGKVEIELKAAFANLCFLFFINTKYDLRNTRIPG